MFVQVDSETDKVKEQTKTNKRKTQKEKKKFLTLDIRDLKTRLGQTAIALGLARLS